MYPPDGQVTVPALPPVATSPGLEDAHRPGHFAGVCQVVARLFDLIRPSVSVFGEKDYQQLLVITEMVRQEGERWKDLRVVGHPTQREDDGLAVSSRNRYLDPEQRDQALGISRALQAACDAQTEGNNPASAERVMEQVLIRHGLDVGYAAVRDARTLGSIDAFDRPARALIAVRLGDVRLIDNTAVTGPE
jgi:pantoate--beta-alanine ligase